jgi:hypothetical protein
VKKKEQRFFFVEFEFELIDSRFPGTRWYDALKESAQLFAFSTSPRIAFHL